MGDPGCLQQLQQVRLQRLPTGFVERRLLQLLAHARHIDPVLQDLKQGMNAGCRRCAGLVHHALQPAGRKYVHEIHLDQ
ncbi:hypothetical protein GALL_313760 [mine drainage metagenome]|uniref:Uncharacterized protein n=1 Tax=mine drainage metagenome TaxID=410659 RepID=A0A1J5QSZ1_9ZZZZ